MSAPTLPPPSPPVCLTRSYKSRHQKGGTVIAEAVRDLETHRQWLLDPDAYRAVIGSCCACGSKCIHALCFRERLLRGASPDGQVQIEMVRMFRCAVKTCGAVFTVLPAVIARHLWRRWQTVQDAQGESHGVPPSTHRRWLGRLRSSASQLVQLLAARASSLFPPSLLHAVAQVPTRSKLIETFQASCTEFTARPFALLAAWIHRLEPGIRLM